MKQKAGLAVMILLAVIMSTTIRERMPNPQDTFARPFEYSGNTAPGFGELGDVKAKLTDSVDGNRTTETFIEIQFGFTTSKYQRPPYGSSMGKPRHQPAAPSQVRFCANRSSSHVHSRL